MSFNPNKPKVINFAQGSNTVIDISRNGTMVNQTAASFKFLGKIINASLALQGHYLETFKNCQSKTNFNKLMTNLQNSLPAMKALNVYKCLVRSKIEYACSTSRNFLE